MAEAIIIEEQQNEEYHAASTSEFNTDDVFEEETEVTAGQTLERVIAHHNGNEFIQIECDYGGITIEELRNTNNLDWTLKMTNFTEDGEYFLEKNVRDHPKPNPRDNPYSREYLAKREISYFEKNEIDYISWILTDKSPFHKNCKIHILSNPGMSHTV